ncbi:RNA methyltransferase, TrmH family [Companilactobacillus paralimentarius DSM 13238 = JCM 10415]|jgi:rRNA methylases|uniref:RNA methyltransferase, TrmH family n=1 Tax=Companilactobacillus paralimentarius DSM 13238 = JCM 10415 TaxID=1122151 RepID=A0A0R1P6Q3_9LACO|nr:RNA methyltransferase [Companilactobacillus paralimentarius]KAE9561901.1 23S rRNA methyltransferase [Companilactobacillus paralimentarius]KRL28193.1 RNA methyltransferase, TrmH family [Companilactobacillus paralimentarius DSM 13238 = JCM 10415]MDR4934351.1 RNA methyltransferase [Companilactobacillus paralimentarius]QFR68588.1 RNA methyltransferase [Companilactobacillus paralimentarius]
MKYIESKKNDEIKQLKKLASTKYIRKTGTYMVEGFHLVREADEYEQDFVQVLVTEKYAEDRLVKKYHDIAVTVSEEVAKELSETKTPQGIFAILKVNNTESLSAITGKWVMLDDVQDPGNVGTIVRTADAAGYDGVITSLDSADFYQPKVQRSMQGSQFHLPIYRMDIHKAIDMAKESELTIYGSEVNEQAKPYNELEKLDNYALIMGNEAHGVTQDVLNACDENIYIPILGKAESLNVAVAAGVLMYGLQTL